MNTAIILAGGKGSRMNSKVPKQYIQLGGRPLLFYTINTFEQSSLIDEIILVASEDYIEFCRTEIVDMYGFKKVRQIVAGGKERYDSVYNGLKCIPSGEGLVFVHDGARACVDEAVIQRCAEGALQYEACVAAVPVKDTIKVADEQDYAVNTPNRATLWQIQTPQVFDSGLIKAAYDKMHKDSDRGNITDDAMVVERYTDKRVKMIMGDYHNIKVTTPEDMQIAKMFLNLN